MKYCNVSIIKLLEFYINSKQYLCIYKQDIVIAVISIFFSSFPLTTNIPPFIYSA
jgi:hypothetical protein